jgi:hypothetical protein
VCKPFLHAKRYTRRSSILTQNRDETNITKKDLLYHNLVDRGCGMQHLNLRQFPLMPDILYSKLDLEWLSSEVTLLVKKGWCFSSIIYVLVPFVSIHHRFLL